jgi:hypothetical protein
MIPDQTRREAWTETQAELGTRRRQIFDLFLDNTAGLTAWEASEMLKRPVYVVRPRVTELSKLGLVCAVGKKRSRFTGKLEAVWKASAYVSRAVLV